MRAARFQMLMKAAWTTLVVLAVTALFIPAAAQGNGASKKILMLFTHQSDNAAQAIVEQALRTTLESNLPTPPEIYSEYLDAVRTPLDDYEGDLLKQMQRKYRGREFDVIFAVNPPALKFLLKNRAAAFPDVPIVFLVLDQQNLSGIDLGNQMTGVWGEVDYRANLELALALHPGTEKVVLITGVGDWDKYWRSHVTEKLTSLEGRFEISYLTGLTITEQKKALSELPPKTIVLFVSSTLDREGNNPGNLEVLRQICPASSAPVYGSSDVQLGLGIVGGQLTSFNSLGVEGAHAGLRVLAGEKPETIAPRGVPSVPMFDWRQLKRWDINEATLPEGSIIQFKQPTVWEEYKWYAIGLMTAIVLETLLIAFLIYLRLRRRQAVAENVRLSGRLAEIVSNVPGIVWESRTDPAIKGRRTTFISDYVKSMLGYTPEEWLNQPPGFGLRMIPEEERERVLQEMNQVVEAGKEAVSEFRWFTKDGRVRWVENYIAPILDNGKGIVGLRGVALDVTDRKLAEEKARETEEKDRAILAAIPDLMFIQTDDGVYLDYHAKNPDELLVSPESFLGKNMSEVLPAYLASRLSECFARVKDEGEPEILEYSLNTEQGANWFEARMVRSGDKILSIVRDITEQKTGEEALKLSESRLRMAQHAARVGTWEWDIETGASVWSEMIWELLGLEPNDGEITVDAFARFIHPEDRDRVWRNVKEVIADGEEFDDEFRVIRADGSILWLASKGALIRSDDGKPERMLGVNIDINELKRTQLEAQEISGRLISAQEDERARLARELHDDACQNLALLSIELELLGRVPLTDAETIRSNISTLSARVGELSNDLRQMSHQLHPARLTRLGLGSALRGFCNEIETAHALKVEFVEANVPATLPAATSLNVYRIVQESLQNVVKHSRATRASVTISAKNDVLQLSISDNGCGFDLNGAAPEGSLGLINIRERGRLLRGEISIDSEPGNGSRIKVAIPIEQN